jgi:hypothetical protein
MMSKPARTIPKVILKIPSLEGGKKRQPKSRAQRPHTHSWSGFGELYNVGWDRTLAFWEGKRRREELRGDPPRHLDLDERRERRSGLENVNESKRSRERRLTSSDLPSNPPGSPSNLQDPTFHRPLAKVCIRRLEHEDVGMLPV